MNPTGPRAPADLAVTPPAAEIVTPDAELPLVARLVVEVRSDGTRTVARGMLQDALTGEETQVLARGATPAAMVASLLRTVVTAGTFARRAVRALLPGAARPRDGRR